MNESLFEVIYSLAHQSEGLDRIIVFCSTWLLWLVGALAIIITLTIASQAYPAVSGARRGLFVVLTPTIAWLMAHGLKLWLAWPRPVVALNNVQPLFSADGPAFPSGHATLFFALTFALYPLYPRLATLVSVGAIATSLARVAAGVHFPGDILGGFVLAGVVVLVSWTFIKTRFPAFGGREVV